MNEINRILKDESNNDKQLIKDLSIYVKNHKNKHLPINRNFIKEVISIIAQNSEVDYKSIEFINDNNYIAYWYSGNLRLYFNITKILRTAQMIKDDLDKRLGDNTIVKYFYTLSTAIHEFTHSRQDYLVKIENNSLYKSCDNLVKNNHDIYSKYHDEVPIERYANLRGDIIAYEVLSYIYPIKQIKELRYSIYDYLFYGYKVKHDDCNEPLRYRRQLKKKKKVISAIDNYNEIMESNSLPTVNIDSNEEMTLYDRFYLGLPISVSEYQQLEDLYHEIQDDEEKEEDVKTLINKL